MIRNAAAPPTHTSIHPCAPLRRYLWTQYMTFQLSLSEIERARAVGERALTTIHFREEQEKSNIWCVCWRLRVHRESNAMSCNVT